MEDEWRIDRGKIKGELINGRLKECWRKDGRNDGMNNGWIMNGGNDKGWINKWMNYILGPTLYQLLC